MLGAGICFICLAPANMLKGNAIATGNRSKAIQEGRLPVLPFDGLLELLGIGSLR